jgi:hypothetical protein
MMLIHICNPVDDKSQLIENLVEVIIKTPGRLSRKVIINYVLFSLITPKLEDNTL